MVRTALLRSCSWMLLGIGCQSIVSAQMPIGPLVASSSPESQSFRTPASCRQQERSRGTLLLCGGGLIPLSIREEFYRLGKADQGTLVLIPTASPRTDAGDFSVWVDYWAGFQWKNIEVVHASDREAAANPKLVESLRRATAVWISGGEQQRLSDRYVGTPIQKELYAILGRGGIVGGTSAGAAIASSTMIADGVIEPKFADGLQFLPNTIIDQHFSQRKRQGRLIKAIEAHPNRVGVGIDESTGLIVRNEEAHVVGDGNVFLLKPEANGEYRQLKAGERVLLQP